MTAPDEPAGTWRQRKRATTREHLRSCALALFLKQGFDATTVEEIASAAGLSHMTFFRYFPTKEDVALADSYDPLIVERIRQTPSSQPLIDRVRRALIEGLKEVYDADRHALAAQMKLIVSTPALREHLWAKQITTQQLIFDALSSEQHDPNPTFETRVAVAASLAVATTAVLTWVDDDGEPDLPQLLDQAFDILAHSQGIANP